MDKTEPVSEKNIKHVAIIGCGNIAGEIDNDFKKRHIYTHAKTISTIKELRLTACCDVDERRRKTFAEKWKVPKQYPDFREMLREEHIDILVIATPTKDHYNNVLLALSSNVKVIFCEKPLTFDFMQGSELIKKAIEFNKLLIVNYMRRWDRFYTECKTLLESGELGRIETIVAYVDTALYMNSIHMLDMLIFFGGDVSSCLGFIDRVNETRVVHGENDYGGIALIKHKNGIITFIKATGESQNNHYFELDIQCTKGRLRILDDDTKYEVYKFKDSYQHKGLKELTLVYTKFNDDKHERTIEAYLEIMDYIKNKKEPRFSAIEAMKSVDLANLIYKSDSIGNLPVYPHLYEEI